VSHRLDLIGRALAGRVDNVVLHDALDSTHCSALRLIEQMDDEGLELGSTVIVADEQTQGAGRGGRTWWSPTGGLYLSWLKSGIDKQIISQLPMLAAAGAAETVRGLGVDDVSLKWPNDLLIGMAKLAGILVHVRHGEVTWVTVGLGVNVAAVQNLDEQIARPTASLAHLLPNADPAAVCAELAGSFIDRLLTAISHPEPALATWREGLIHQKGDSLRVRLASGEELQGELAGFSDEGFLRLEVGGKERVLTGGDIIETGSSGRTTH